jgi:hypothetical protein
MTGKNLQWLDIEEDLSLSQLIHDGGHPTLDLTPKLSRWFLMVVAQEHILSSKYSAVRRDVILEASFTYIHMSLSFQ